MVTIINYKLRTKEDGDGFFALEVQGGVEMVKSQTTGDYYATAKKAQIPSTFEEETCKALIGTTMPGKVEKVECEPYQFINKQTGEVVDLNHRYVYNPSEPSAKQIDAAKETYELISELERASNTDVEFNLEAAAAH